jgi:hypothetical protein
MNVSVKQPETGGALCHLVEAATALANLTSVNEVRTGVTKTSTGANSPPTDEGMIVSDEEDARKIAPMVLSNCSSAGTGNCKRDIFPQRLLAILSESSLSDIITWLPHGRSFVIIRPDVFTVKILPKYLPPVDARGSPKYASFTRKLNRWGFRQATRGPDTGAFYHPLFCRDQPDLCLDMVCQRSRDRKGGECDKNRSQSNLPPKKRSPEINESINKITPLTKQALDSMMSPEPSLMKRPNTVSVDDNRSVASACNSASTVSSNLSLPPPRISSDSLLVIAALQRRDENERIKVAKAMLYESYLKAKEGQ